MTLWIKGNATHTEKLYQMEAMTQAASESKNKIKTQHDKKKPKKMTQQKETQHNNAHNVTK